MTSTARTSTTRASVHATTAPALNADTPVAAPRLAVVPDAPRDAHGASGPNVRLDARPLSSSSAVFAGAAGAEVRLSLRPFDRATFDRAKFFDGVRHGPFDGSFTQGQVDGLTTLLDEWERRGMKDLRWLAYMMATTFHETAQTMQPIEEFGKGRGKRYGIPDRATGKAYYGRGYVQLTWKANYATMGRLLGHDLVRHPELALRPDVAAAIMFEGMTTSLSLRGDFTGKSLENYFTDTKSDWVGARRIINGTDRAGMIADYAKTMYAALLAAQG